MKARARKAVGGVAILAFLAAYVWAAVALGAFVPTHWAARLAYYALAGVCWGLPLIPLIRWMNGEGQDGPEE